MQPKDKRRTTIDVKKIQEIRRLTAERDKLLTLLEFYAWLKDHGVNYDEIKGLRPLDNTPRSRQEFKASCRRTGRMDLWEQYNTADMVCVPNAFGVWKWIKYKPEVHGDEYEVEKRPYKYAGDFLDLQMKNGKQIVLPWPPFPKDVIYNNKKKKR